MSTVPVSPAPVASLVVPALSRAARRHLIPRHKAILPTFLSPEFPSIAYMGVPYRPFSRGIPEDFIITSCPPATRWLATY
jgi:hypothetical protein